MSDYYKRHRPYKCPKCGYEDMLQSPIPCKRCYDEWVKKNVPSLITLAEYIDKIDKEEEK